MAVVVVASSEPPVIDSYLTFLRGLGWSGRLSPADIGDAPAWLMDGADALIVADGPRVSPHTYSKGVPSASDRPDCSDQRLDSYHLSLISLALERDLPILGVCRGMQLLNVAFGGSLMPDIPHHCAQEDEEGPSCIYHSIYLSPGTKLAAILGMGGFFKVNSYHQDGLKDSHRSARLLTSAYSLEDGVVEGLESPEHSWVIGVQCRPHRQDEVSRVFSNLFQSFLERAEHHAASPSRVASRE